MNNYVPFTAHYLHCAQLYTVKYMCTCHLHCVHRTQGVRVHSRIM